MTMTDAPPTLPAGPPASPWGPPAMQPSPLPDMSEPGRDSRRGRPVLVGAVIALCALALAAFVAFGTRGDGDGVTLPAAEPYSLAAAATSTIDARTVDFELSVTAGDLGTVAVSGAVDNASQVMVVSTDLSSVIGLGDPALAGAGDVEMVLDVGSGVVYFGAEALGGLLPASSEWISMDLAVLAERSGQSLDDLRGELFVDPSESARLLLASDDVVEVGPAVIDGVDTVQYSVTVDVAAALAAAGQATESLDLPDVDLPDSIAYDVWVTADNQLVRAAFDLDVAGEPVSVQLDMTTSDQGLDAQIPADAFDITALLNF